MNLPLHQILPGEPVRLYVQHVDEAASILASCRIHEKDNDNQQQQHSQLRIHSLYPLSKLRVSENCPPGVRAVHPYGSSNLLFLILSTSNRKGKNKETSSSSVSSNHEAYKIALWDDKKQEILLDLAFRDPVITLAIRRDKLVVVLEKRVVLFHLDLDNEDRAEAILREGEYETVSNPLGEYQSPLRPVERPPADAFATRYLGLVSIATTTGSTLLALPGRQVGHVQLVRLPSLQSPAEISRPAARQNPHATSNAPPPYPIVHIFLAHSSSLRTLTLSKTGSLLCTSSNKGTLLRVFSTSSKTLIRELRRGTDQADIWSVAFLHPDIGEMIACASDKRTVHVWKVGDISIPSSSSSSTSGRPSSNILPSGMIPPGKAKDALKALNVLKPYLPAYFSSQWSDLSWKIPHNASVTFHASHVAAMAEQDDVATCFFVDSKNEEKGARLDKGGKKRKEDEIDPYYLLIITRSGAWYKLSLLRTLNAASHTDTHKPASNSPRTRKVILQDDRENISRSAKSGTAVKREGDEDSGKKCRLVEYKRIGYGTDGEEDEEDLKFSNDLDDDSDSDE